MGPVAEGLAPGGPARGAAEPGHSECHDAAYAVHFQTALRRATEERRKRRNRVRTGPETANKTLQRGRRQYSEQAAHNEVK